MSNKEQISVECQDCDGTGYLEGINLKGDPENVKCLKCERGLIKKVMPCPCCDSQDYTLTLELMLTCHNCLEYPIIWNEELQEPIAYEEIKRLRRLEENLKGATLALKQGLPNLGGSHSKEILRQFIELLESLDK